MTDLNQVDIEQGKVDVEIFKKTDAALSLLNEKYSKIPDVNTKHGYDFVKDGVKELTGYRTSLDAERQRIKKPYLDAGRIIDAEAKRITAKLVELEDPMKAAKKEVDDRKKKQEEQRLARLREKVNTIKCMTVKARGKSSDEIAKIIEEVDAIDTKRDYYDLTREAIEAQQAVLHELSEMYNQQFKYEQAELERKRIEKEQAEQREKQKIIDTINNIRMIPTKLMGKPSSQVQREIERLENYKVSWQQFDDHVEIAREAVYTATQHLVVMLKQQRMVEEAEAKKAQEQYDADMAASKAERDAEREALEVTEEEDQAWQEKTAKQDEAPEPTVPEAVPDIWTELTDWADEYEISGKAFDDLTQLVARYL